MIVVTTGTNEQPFDRLVRAARDLPVAEAMLVQYGSSRVLPGRGTWVDFLEFDELAARMSEARVVLCHGGVGSVMLAHRCGKRPVVLPRRLHLGEAVDDHQLPLARRLHAAGIVRLVEDERELAAAIRRGGAAGGGARVGGIPGPEALIDELRAWIGEQARREASTVGGRWRGSVQPTSSRPR